MALIITDGTYNGKRAISVTDAKAREIKQLLLVMPVELDEKQLRFLKAVECIRFGDGTRFPELSKKPLEAMYGVQQGMSEGIPVGDR